MENSVGAYALYEFLKGLVDSGKLKEQNDNSEVCFVDDDGWVCPVTDYSFDDNSTLTFW